jgi:hypothetical protein
MIVPRLAPIKSNYSFNITSCNCIGHCGNKVQKLPIRIKGFEHGCEFCEICLKEIFAYPSEGLMKTYAGNYSSSVDGYICPICGVTISTQAMEQVFRVLPEIFGEVNCCYIEGCEGEELKKAGNGCYICLTHLRKFKERCKIDPPVFERFKCYQHAKNYEYKILK